MRIEIAKILLFYSLYRPRHADRGLVYKHGLRKRKKRSTCFQCNIHLKGPPFYFLSSFKRSDTNHVWIPWQNSATKPSRHWQTGLFSSFEHIPPFLQGFTRQRLRSRENEKFRTSLDETAISLHIIKVSVIQKSSIKLSGQRMIKQPPFFIII